MIRRGGGFDPSRVDLHRLGGVGTKQLRILYNYYNGCGNDGDIDAKILILEELITRSYALRYRGYSFYNLAELYLGRGNVDDASRVVGVFSGLMKGCRIKEVNDLFISLRRRVEDAIRAKEGGRVGSLGDGGVVGCFVDKAGGDDGGGSGVVGAGLDGGMAVLGGGEGASGVEAELSVGVAISDGEGASVSGLGEGCSVDSSSPGFSTGCSESRSVNAGEMTLEQALASIDELSEQELVEWGVVVDARGDCGAQIRFAEALIGKDGVSVGSLVGAYLSLAFVHEGSGDVNKAFEVSRELVRKYPIGEMKVCLKEVVECALGGMYVRRLLGWLVALGGEIRRDKWVVKKGKYVINESRVTSLREQLEWLSGEERGLICGMVANRSLPGRIQTVIFDSLGSGFLSANELDKLISLLRRSLDEGREKSKN